MQITERKEKRYAREKGKEEGEARDEIKKILSCTLKGHFL